MNCDTLANYNACLWTLLRIVQHQRTQVQIPGRTRNKKKQKQRESANVKDGLTCDQRSIQDKQYTHINACEDETQQDDGEWRGSAFGPDKNTRKRRAETTPGRGDARTKRES